MSDKKLISISISDIKMGVFNIFAFTGVHAINFMIFGDIRFSAGIPAEHWAIFFIKHFHPATWSFIKNGWLSYCLLILIMWITRKSLINLLITYLVAFFVIAIFDFMIINDNSIVFFRFDAIGFFMALVFVFLIHSTKNLLCKFYICKN